jgi:hypothetical protein
MRSEAKRLKYVMKTTHFFTPSLPPAAVSDERIEGQ